MGKMEKSCVVQEGKKDYYQFLPTEVKELSQWLQEQRHGREKLHLTFEVSGMAGTYRCGDTPRCFVAADAPVGRCG